MNERLKRAGKPAITKLEDLPKDFKVEDSYLDEAVEILLDLSENYPRLISKLPSNAVSLDFIPQLDK